MDLRAMRTAARPPAATVKDVYSNGKLRSEFQLTDMEELLIDRQRKAARRVLAKMNGDSDYKVPYGVRIALKQGFVWNQITKEKPWAVMWLSQGETKRRSFPTLWGAVHFHRRAVKANPTATVVSLARGYDIPPKLRGKLPKPWKWCPRCMKPRKFKRVYHGKDPVTFWNIIKVFNRTKGHYEWRDAKLQLMRCPLCGTTNRDPVYRRSNQPWELRKFKKGVTRAKRRKDGRPRRKKKR